MGRERIETCLSDRHKILYVLGSKENRETYAFRDSFCENDDKGLVEQLRSSNSVFYFTYDSTAAFNE